MKKIRWCVVQFGIKGKNLKEAFKRCNKELHQTSEISLRLHGLSRVYLAVSHVYNKKDKLNYF